LLRGIGLRIVRLGAFTMPACIRQDDSARCFLGTRAAGSGAAHHPRCSS
jgi:hypothetical protein